MKAYGYEIIGDSKALESVFRSVCDERSCINWSNFQTGDAFFDEDGRQYEVKISHDKKQVRLAKW